MIADEDREAVKALGARIKKLREERGYSLRELAAIADIEHPMLHGIEGGEWDLRISSLMKIARALDVPSWKLLKPEK